jgi:hypothetical protein
LTYQPSKYQPETDSKNKGQNQAYHSAESFTEIKANPNGAFHYTIMHHFGVAKCTIMG